MWRLFVGALRRPRKSAAAYRTGRTGGTSLLRKAPPDKREHVAADDAPRTAAGMPPLRTSTQTGPTPASRGGVVLPPRPRTGGGSVAPAGGDREGGREGRFAADRAAGRPRGCRRVVGESPRHGSAGTPPPRTRPRGRPRVRRRHARARRRLRGRLRCGHDCGAAALMPPPRARSRGSRREAAPPGVRREAAAGAAVWISAGTRSAGFGPPARRSRRGRAAGAVRASRGSPARLRVARASAVPGSGVSAAVVLLVAEGRGGGATGARPTRRPRRSGGGRAVG